jgi:hypothetical protein
MVDCPIWGNKSDAIRLTKPWMFLMLVTSLWFTLSKHICWPVDFHYLWECLKVIFLISWGTPAQHGWLSNTREQTRRHQVDKTVNVSNVGDQRFQSTFAPPHLEPQKLRHASIRAMQICGFLPSIENLIGKASDVTKWCDEILSTRLLTHETHEVMKSHQARTSVIDASFSYDNLDISQVTWEYFVAQFWCLKSSFVNASISWRSLHAGAM